VAEDRGGNARGVGRRVPLILPSTAAPAGGDAPGPRQDVSLLAEALEGRVVSPLRGDALGGAEARAAFDLRQALAAARDRGAAAYVSLSERVGLPLALLLRRRRAGAPPHILVAHRLSSRAKRLLHRRTGVLRDFARVVVLCRAQEQFALERAGLSPERVQRMWDAVDTAWWRPDPQTDGAAEPGLVVSVGRERRDYAALTEALRALPAARGVIVAGSPWSRGRDPLNRGELPPNVARLSGLSADALRSLYARAHVVALPLQAETDYAAGANALLEAAAQGKSVVATRTNGLAEYLEGFPGITVCPAGAEALGEALARRLAESPTLCAEARCQAEGRHSLEVYVETLARLVREAMAEPQR
jgi:Glycosyltransferase